MYLCSVGQYTPELLPSNNSLTESDNAFQQLMERTKLIFGKKRAMARALRLKPARSDHMGTLASSRSAGNSERRRSQAWVSCGPLVSLERLGCPAKEAMETCPVQTPVSVLRPQRLAVRDASENSPFYSLCLVTLTFSGSEAGVDLVFIQTSCFSNVNAN